MKKILFICTGNTCRSPMAEGILKKYARDNNLDLNIKSAAIHSGGVKSASKNAILAMKHYDINITGHIPSTVDKEIVDEADLILTMTKVHKLIATQDFGCNDKTFTLNEYAYGVEKDIIDPFGGDLEDYKRCADEIYSAILEICIKLRK